MTVAAAWNNMKFGYKLNIWEETTQRSGR
jgi:hypothetical protein